MGMLAELLSRCRVLLPDLDKRALQRLAGEADQRASNGRRDFHAALDQVPHRPRKSPRPPVGLDERLDAEDRLVQEALGDR